MTDKTIFFDFDGTIADSERGIVDSIKYMVRQRRLKPLTDAQYRTWIGPSLTYSINQFYPELDAAGVDRAIESYRVYYEARGIFEADLYRGITDSLQALRADGFHTAVASSKPEAMVVRLVDHFDLGPLFDGVYGASMDEHTRVKKADVLAYAMRNQHALQDHSVMIGDRFTDIKGGQANGVKTLGVTYGFGDRQELVDAGANKVVDHPTQLVAGSSALAG
ncbi:HAD hydrolase-like protein [Lacticaseibacillus thailandensis]|uniref:HAD hydrolase-like protein n=1 Tax=Lacticaseibacillus thailandensis TaxID=381741 RepID=UPI000B0C8D22|nr:HAD hydrolase-like protein [Lacticaseibacillus thailandensis]